MDKDKNGIEDKKEVYYTYGLATVAAGLAIAEYLTTKNLSFVTWCMGFASALSGGRDFINGVLRK